LVEQTFFLLTPTHFSERSMSVDRIITVSLDQIPEWRLADLVGSSPSAEDVYLAGLDDLDSSITSESVNTYKQEDSSMAKSVKNIEQVDVESPLADQIEALGIESVVSAVVADHASSVVADAGAQFDPSAYSFRSVLDLGLDDDELDSLQSLVFKTRDGAANPDYVTQVWLDEFGTQRLFVSWLGSSQPCVLYTSEHEDEHSGWVSQVPTHIRTFHTVREARQFAAAFRPGQTSEDRQRTQRAGQSAAQKIRALLGVETQAEDPSDF
jgi:hypothetical protein